MTYFNGHGSTHGDFDTKWSKTLVHCGTGTLPGDSSGDNYFFVPAELKEVVLDASLPVISKVAAVASWAVSRSMAPQLHAAKSWLLVICFLRNAPERANGTDRLVDRSHGEGWRAGKWGVPVATTDADGNHIVFPTEVGAKYAITPR